jgi:tripartite-type tricarboxylate transporter receptor subunit TctC
MNLAKINKRRQSRIVGASLLVHMVTAIVTVGASASEPAFPTRPLRFIVPYAPGGGADALARGVAIPLADILGHSVVIDNRGGGGTLLGSDMAAKALPDGHTILMITSTHAVVSSLYKKLPYDPIRDFSPIVRVASAPNILVAHPSVGVASVKELVALARSRPRELVYASSGNGGGSHLAMELFRSVAHIELIHVPYKGTGPATTDLLGGQAKIMFGGVIGTLPHVKSGRLKTLAISSAQRSPLLLDVPTIAESGYPGFEAATWYGIAAPARTPAPVVNRLNEAIRQSLQDARLSQRITSQGADPAPNSPAEFAAYIKTEVAKWGKVVRDSGAQPD